MIRSLRSHHHWTMIALVLLLPAILIAGVLGRRAFPRVPRLPEESSQLDRGGQFDLWNDVRLRVRFDKPVRTNERATMYVVPVQELMDPDVLVYWDDQDGGSGKPSERAILLGSLKGNQMRRLSVPMTVPESSGFLVLYSLAHEKVLGASSWRLVVADGGAK